MPLNPPHGLEALKDTFGRFKYTPLRAPFIDIEDKWERDNIVRLHNVCNTGLDIQLHNLIAARFMRCLAQALDRCPQYKIHQLAGYVPRQMMALPGEDQSSKPLSVHAWGVAFDINWDENPFTKVDRSKPNNGLIADLPLEFVRTFHDDGWEWGGIWLHKKDAMHFQFCSGY